MPAWGYSVSPSIVVVGNDGNRGDRGERGEADPGDLGLLLGEREEYVSNLPPLNLNKRRNRM